MKIWTSQQKADDKIIAYVNDTIYKANPTVDEMHKYLEELYTQNISPKFFGIPARYISKINQQENKKYIEVLFRGDTEHLKIADDALRNEIFEYFKQHIPNSRNYTYRQTKTAAIKKPLIALGVLTAVFLWALYLAVGIEAGDQYDVAGQRYFSVAGIVLALASLGVKKLVTIFFTIFLVTLASLLKKYKNPEVKNTIQVG